MNRLSAKHINLMPVHIVSLLQWLLICLCLIPLAGCFVARATPDTWSLEIQEDAPPPLPNLSLVRRVVPEIGTKSRTRWWWDNKDAVREVSESQFGNPEEDADPSCVYAGLKEVLPDIDIVPTTNFWNLVGAPEGVIELSELFVAPKSDRLQAFQADVMIIVYHTEVDVESIMIALLLSNIFSDTDKETAAITVIDLHRKSILHGSKISFEAGFAFGFHVPFPFGFIALDPPDICNTVGSQAGAAIAEAMPGRTVRALVVVAGEDPYEAASN